MGLQALVAAAMVAGVWHGQVSREWILALSVLLGVPGRSRCRPCRLCELAWACLAESVSYVECRRDLQDTHRCLRRPPLPIVTTRRGSARPPAPGRRHRGSTIARGVEQFRRHDRGPVRQQRDPFLAAS